MPLQCLVFDCDGVILDSVPVKTRAFARLAEPFGPEARDRFVMYHTVHGGVSRYKKFEWFFREVLGREISQEESTQWGRRFAEYALDEVRRCPLIPGVRDVLESWHGRLPLYVCSGAPEEELSLVLHERRLEGYFTGIHGSPPAKGLFSAEVEAHLAQWVTDMDKSLDAMLADYKALEKYVRDDSIRDDGAQGKKLAASLGAAHATFMAARDSYLEVVEARAAQAEDVLLRDHPLQRQIVAAEKIFSLFRKAAGLLGPEKPDKEALEQLRQELESAIALAGRPPFPASPELERVYRAFLKEAALFPQGLARGLSEGFYSPLRRDLNSIVGRSREAYNAFARAANQS